MTDKTIRFEFYSALFGASLGHTDTEESLYKAAVSLHLFAKWSDKDIVCRISGKTAIVGKGGFVVRAGGTVIVNRDTPLSLTFSSPDFPQQKVVVYGKADGKGGFATVDEVVCGDGLTVAPFLPDRKEIYQRLNGRWTIVKDAADQPATRPANG